jgi:hypothetical protein
MQDGILYRDFVGTTMNIWRIMPVVSEVCTSSIEVTAGVAM